MKKLKKLQLDTLQVESFTTVSPPARERGTVLGQDTHYGMYTYCAPACPDETSYIVPCPRAPTLPPICAAYTEAATCDVTCRGCTPGGTGGNISAANSCPGYNCQPMDQYSYYPCDV